MDEERWMSDELPQNNGRQDVLQASENAISEAEDESGMATLDEENPDIDRSFREYKPMDCVPVDSNTVYCQPLKWRRIVNTEGAVPRPRHGHRAVAVHDNIVMWGGGNEGIIEDCRLYNISVNRWSAPVCRGDQPPGAAAAGMVKGYGAHLYIFGGMLEYGVYSNDIHELDLVRWEWKKLRVRGRTSASVPCPRIGHTFVCDNNGVLWVFGGLTNSSEDLRYNKPRYLNDLFCLNTQKPYNELVWDIPYVKGEPPSPRESHSAIMYEQNGRREMIVYGGMNGNRLGDVHILDLDRMEWRHQYCLGTPPLPRSLHTANLIHNKMFVFGGWVPMEPSDEETRNDLKWKCTSSLGVLNLENFTWEHPDFTETEHAGVETFPRARSGHCAVYSGGRIYIWSGRDGYRKAWNNQEDIEVCCRDFWYLETEKPYKPPRVFLGKATLNSLEICWAATRNSEAYLIQIGKYSGPTPSSAARPAESKPILHVVKNPAQGNVVHVVKGAGATPGTKTIIVSRGPNGEAQQKMIVLSPATATTSSTAEANVPASSLPQPDEQLPENFMEDAPEDKTKQEPEQDNASGQPQGAAAGESQQEEAEQNDDDEWFDVAVVKGSTHHITQYFLPGEGPRMAANYDRSYEINSEWVSDPRKTVELTHGTNYKIRVAGLNLLGRGEWSQTVVFKTAMPGFPGAPSQIKIQKIQEGANVTWESPQQTNGIISEYSVYLAVKAPIAEGSKAPNKGMNGVEFLRVYAGPHNECYIPPNVVADAHIEIGPKNKPAIIFRIAAKNEKGYGPATQVRWLQDLQREPHHIINPEGHHVQQHQPVQPQYVRPQAGHLRPLQARPTPNNIVRGQVVRQIAGRPAGVYQAAPQSQQLAGSGPQYRYAPYNRAQGVVAAPGRLVHPQPAAPQTMTPVVVRPMPPHRQMQPNNNNNNNVS